MRTNGVTLAAVLATLLFAAAASGAAPAASLFVYDAKAPLRISTASPEDRDGVLITPISYAGPRGGRVTALLVAPEGATSLPAVLFLHDADGNGASAREEAVSLARRGLVSLLPDSSFARPPFPRLVTFDAAKDRALRIRSVVEARRALDVLGARPEVDAGRLAVVGHGPGATTAAILSGIERRVDAFVLSGTGARITTLLKRLWGPGRTAERDRYLKAMTVLDPIVWSGKAGGAPVFFQHLRNDPNFTLTELRQLDRATAAPKRVTTYAADAETSPAGQRDRAAFLLSALR